MVRIASPRVPNSDLLEILIAYIDEFEKPSSEDPREPAEPFLRFVRERPNRFWTSRSMPLRLGKDDLSQLSRELAGIDWAVNQKVDVIGMSLGGLVMDPETPPTYMEAILCCLEAGIPVVAAIGNEGEQTSGSPGNNLFSLSVGATDPEDRVAGFSGGRSPSRVTAGIECEGMTSATEQAPADSSIAPGLDEWLYGENTDSRSLIVEVKLPERRVVFGEAQSGRRRLPRGLVSNDPEARRRTIQELAAYLWEELGLSAKVLETAGAELVLFLHSARVFAAWGLAFFRAMYYMAEGRPNNRDRRTRRRW